MSVEYRELMTQVIMRPSTKNALENLFVILHIEGDSFDDRLYKLADMAFAANADVSANRKTLRERSENGIKKDRKKIEIKEETYWRLRECHGRMFPFLPWTSFDWLFNQMMDRVSEDIHEPGQDIHFGKELEDSLEEPGRSDGQGGQSEFSQETE